jgi:hypothetical protein
MEVWHEFYSLVAANYLESRESKITAEEAVGDIIEYDEEYKLDTEMIKVEIVNDTEHFDENTEWIEEEEKKPSPKRARREKQFSSPEAPIFRQAPILDSADDQRIKETARMYCDVCHESVESLRDAKAHYKAAHGTEGYLICCDRRFKQRCRLVEHVNTHYNYSYACPICAKCFDSKSYLTKHLACHDNNKQFVSVFKSSLAAKSTFFHLPAMRTLSQILLEEVPSPQSSAVGSHL